MLESTWSMLPRNKRGSSSREKEFRHWRGPQRKPLSPLAKNKRKKVIEICLCGMPPMAHSLIHLSGKTQQRMDQNQSSSTMPRSSVLGKQGRLSLKFMKLQTSLSQRCKFDPNCHHLRKLTARFRRIPELTTANSMASCSVQCRQKPEDQRPRQVISWRGRMARCSLSKKTTDWCMFMTSIAICSDQSSTSHARRHRTYKSCLHHRERLCLCGHRISMTRPAKATTVSTHFSLYGSTRERTELSSPSLTTRYRMLPGLGMAPSSLCSPGSSLPLPLCTTPMANPFPSLPSGSEIR